jgi:hypothetical protein
MKLPPMRRHLSSLQEKTDLRAGSITRLEPLVPWCSDPVSIPDWPLHPNVPGMRPVNNLLSVSAEAEHPNFVNPPKGELKRKREQTPSDKRYGEPDSQDPAANAGRSLQSMNGSTVTLRAYARSTAPSGTIPVSRYRQSAIRSFRARATIPIFRTRPFPFPNFFSYQRASSLSG